MKHLHTLLWLAVVLLVAAAPDTALAEDENYEINWFLLLNGSGRINDLSSPFGNGSDWLNNEQRLRMDITAWSEDIEAEAKIKFDLYHDAVDKEFDIDLREAYIDYTLGSFDFRVGRQVITWGVGNLVFINDVWTKDWESFFNGRPLEYLKLGVDGIRVRYSSDFINGEFIYVPTFEPDNMPGPDRFSYFDPFAPLNHVTNEPEQTFENGEVAVRLYTNVAGFDVSGYVYKGFWHDPAMTLDNFMMPTTAIMFYPELRTYGASIQGQVLGGIVSGEYGYYDSVDDPDGLDPMILNSQHRFIVGYQKTLAGNTTVEVQYFRKNFQDYDNYLLTVPMGFPVKEDHRDEVTFSLRKTAMREKLTLFWFSYYSPVDEDYYLLPSISYKMSDQLTATVGANIWGGNTPTTFLAQFDENDNVYMSLRYDF